MPVALILPEGRGFLAFLFVDGSASSCPWDGPIKARKRNKYGPKLRDGNARGTILISEKGESPLARWKECNRRKGDTWKGPREGAGASAFREMGLRHCLRASVHGEGSRDAKRRCSRQTRLSFFLRARALSKDGKENGACVATWLQVLLGKE